MHSRRGLRRTAGQRSFRAFIVIVLAAGLATAARATTPPERNSVPGVTVEATLTPVRLLEVIPTRTVRFELTVTVERTVSAFAGIHYECLFVDAAGAELGVASRGTASRDAFTATADGRLVSIAHEELADIGPVTMRCRAIKLDRSPDARNRIPRSTR